MARGDGDRPYLGTGSSFTNLLTTSGRREYEEKGWIKPKSGVETLARWDSGKGADNKGYWEPTEIKKPEPKAEEPRRSIAAPRSKSKPKAEPKSKSKGPKGVNTTITQEEIDEITPPAQGLESTVKTKHSTRPRRSLVRPGKDKKRTIVSL